MSRFEWSNHQGETLLRPLALPGSLGSSVWHSLECRYHVLGKEPYVLQG